MMEPLKVSIEVSVELIDSVLITALEGGSNYWYYLPLRLKNVEPEGFVRNKAFHYDFLDKVYNGAELPVFDNEKPPMKLGVLSEKTIQRGMILLARDYPNIVQDIVDENYDAGDADVFFQLCVMGEVRFG